MLGNCEKMVLISSSSSSSTHQWPQNQLDDPKGLNMAATARPNNSMEKPIAGHQDQQPQQQQQQQQQQQALKCPRCDSSNTKFCYYNNYSLSQPRHFCKTCKRYWTRGGTLRNVPVGGGCRRNKRPKRPSAAASDPASTSSPPTAPNGNPNFQSHIDHNPLLYGLPTTTTASHELNLPYPRFNSRVSGLDHHHLLQPPHLSGGLGLGFSSGLVGTGTTTATHDHDHHHHHHHHQSDYHDHQSINGFNNSLLSSYSSIFGSSGTTTTHSSPSMASLIASSLQQQKFMMSSGLKDGRTGTDNGSFGGLVPFEGLQMSSAGIGEGGGEGTKDVKMEELGQGRFINWMNSTNSTVPNSPNLMDQIGQSDPNSLYWNGVGAWLDPTNLGPSVPSLI